MLTEEEKEYFEQCVKQYRFFGKICLVFISIPVALLIYCFANFHNKDANELMPTLIMGLVLFVATYVGYMSSRIKADILEEIATKPGFDEQSKSRKKD
jgi:hypothetical protein